MLKFSKIYIFVIFILVSSPTFAQGIYFMDFTKVLNQSTAGKEAQNFLKNKLKNDNAKFKKISDGLRESEKKLIAKKKTISAEDIIIDNTLNQSGGQAHIQNMLEKQALAG